MNLQAAHDVELSGEELEISYQPSTRWRVVEPAALYAEPGDTTPIEFEILNAENLPQRLEYAYLDYDGNVAGGGEVALPANGDKLRIPPPARQGFYELNLPALDMKCGVIVLPRPAVKDDFFACDVAFSYFKPFYQNPEMVQKYIRILNRIGVKWIRERNVWARIEPEENQFDPIWLPQETMVRKLEKEGGLNILDVCHSAPGFTMEENIPWRKYSPFPDNLLLAARSWKRIGERYRNFWDAFEVWNEPDISFSNYHSGDLVMAYHKMQSYVFQQLNLPATLVGHGYAVFFPNPHWFDIYLKNGLMDDINVLSFHSYNHPVRAQAQMIYYRNLVKDTSKPNIPMWITEGGKPWDRGPMRPTPADDKWASNQFTGSMLVALACGVERYFFFILPYYEEGGNIFTLLDVNHTPIRCMATYANAVKALSGKQYLGTLRGGVKGAQLAYIMGDDQETFLYLYDEFSRKVSLPEDFEYLYAEGLDGRRLTLPGKEFPLSDGGIYLYFDREKMANWIDEDTEVMQCRKAAQNFVPTPRAAKPVVMQMLGHATIPDSIQGYWHDGKSPLELEIIVNNLSEQTLDVQPEITLSGGGKVLTRLEPWSIMEPESRRKLHFSVDFQNFAQAPNGICDIIITDKNGNAGNLVLRFNHLAPETAIVRPLPEKLELDCLADWDEEKGDDSWIDFSDNKHTYIDPAFRFVDPAWDGQAVNHAKFRAFYREKELVVQVSVDSTEFSQQYFVPHWECKDDLVIVTLQNLDKDNDIPLYYVDIQGGMESTGPRLVAGGTRFHGKGYASGDLKRSHLGFARIGNRTIYTFFLDTEEIGLNDLKPGMQLGVGIRANATRHQKLAGFQYWGGSSNQSREETMLNRFLLVSAEAAN